MSNRKYFYRQAEKFIIKQLVSNYENELNAGRVFKKKKKIKMADDFMFRFKDYTNRMKQDLPLMQNFIANELIEDYKPPELRKIKGRRKITVRDLISPKPLRTKKIKFYKESECDYFSH